jgi:hypothetical protein
VVSVLPEPLEPIRRQLRVPHRMLDVPVPEVVLDRPRVVAVVGELGAAGVAQHVRVHGNAELGRRSGPGDDLPLELGDRAPHDDLGSQQLTAPRRRFTPNEAALSKRLLLDNVAKGLSFNDDE